MDNSQEFRFELLDLSELGVAESSKYAIGCNGFHGSCVHPTSGEMCGCGFLAGWCGFTAAPKGQ